MTTMTGLDLLLNIALDLTGSLMAEDRFRRLLEAVSTAAPCDAACLLRSDGEHLVPVAARGLVPEVMGRRFRPSDHPRLEVICSSRTPVHFPANSPLPDPFDGLVEGDPTALDHIHACMGCPLFVGDELIGALTLDALKPDAFDRLDPKLIATMGALAGAALHTSSLIEALEHNAAHQDLVARELMREASQDAGVDRLLGTSEAMRSLRKEIELVARTDYAVLVCGETGTGKELVSRAVHVSSTRQDKPIIQVNCSALPEALAESELFGHVRGAFTGATADRAGKLSVADGGTLVLDEIGELPLHLQPKLLRALQEGEIQRVGEDRVEKVDVRIIASTNRELDKEVAAGRFRADLYHRLNVFPLAVPPLRERRGDIALLSGHFSEQAGRRLGLGPVRLTARARYALDTSTWPGNVRELENVVSRMVLRASVGVDRGAPVVVDLMHLEGDLSSTVRSAELESPVRRAAPPEGIDLREAVREYQVELISGTVDACDGNWAAAARRLGMHRSNLHHLAKRLGLR